MEQVKLGRSGLFLSRISLGTMNFGTQGMVACTGDAATKMIDAFLEAGGNLIDTADIYSQGESERIVGKAIKSRRDSVLVATKGGLPQGPGPNSRGLSRGHLVKALEGSLRRLGTDYIDLYQCHAWDKRTPIEETMATLDAFVRTGKVRYLGCSNFTASQIVEAQWAADRATSTPFVGLQAQYSLICRSIEAEILPVSRDHGIGTLAWSPLGGGLLAGRYQRGVDPGTDTRVFRTKESSPAAAAWARAVLDPVNLEVAEAVQAIASELDVTPVAVALGWLLKDYAVTSVVIGPRSLDQLRMNLEAADLKLPSSVVTRLDDVSSGSTIEPVNGRTLRHSGH